MSIIYMQKARAHAPPCWAAIASSRLVPTVAAPGLYMVNGWQYILLFPLPSISPVLGPPLSILWSSFMPPSHISLMFSYLTAAIFVDFR